MTKENKSQKNNGNSRKIQTQAAMDKAIKSVCDILRRDKAKGARLYVPELTWMFFLKALDMKEKKEKAHAEAVGKEFEETVNSPYRWRDWLGIYRIHRFRVKTAYRYVLYLLFGSQS